MLPEILEQERLQRIKLGLILSARTIIFLQVSDCVGLCDVVIWIDRDRDDHRK